MTIFALAFGPAAWAQTSTTTSMTVTSGGNAVATVAAGTEVTLSASVQAGATQLAQGQVNFCDATAATCTDIHLLGTSQLTSAGQATLFVRPSTGTHLYKAEFLGTPGTMIAYSPSVSTAVTLQVTGPYLTTTVIGQSGMSSDYALSASTYGFTNSSVAESPSGTISFFDSTTNAALGTAPLAPSASGPTWVNTSTLTPGTEPSVAVVGDFNGDGNLDLAVSLAASTGMIVLLGDGQGNFAPVSGGSVAASGYPALMQDFNGDGIPDLLLSSQYMGSSLTVLLGNGDGTFHEASGSPITTNYGSSPVVAADFNGDGIPDFAAAGGFYLVVELGNGDGTFTQKPINSTSITQADEFASMVAGDFNGDGIPDLAALDLTAEHIFVYLGNGDGTFRQAPTITLGSTNVGSPLKLVAADFDGDGHLDLAALFDSSPEIGEVAVLLGKGDGTFLPASGSPISIGTSAGSPAVGDFNGDGIPDLFLGPVMSASQFSVLLGNGDGTFVMTPIGSSTLPCCPLPALGDFNGDGVTDVVTSQQIVGNVSVLLTALRQSTATVNGISVNGQTPQQVVAQYPGDSSFDASLSSATSLLVAAAAPVIAPGSGVITTAQQITLTCSTPGVNIYYEATGALQTSGFQVYDEPISLYQTGNLTISAYAVGNNYGQGPNSTATYTVTTSNPTPILSALSPAFATQGGQGFTLTVSGSSFVAGTTVFWGSTGLTTQYVSASQLTAQVTAAQIASAGVTSITAESPGAGAAPSNALQFEVDSGGSGTSPSFPNSSATVTAGSSATYSVTLPSSAANVTVNCLNLPSGATCSYSAATTTLTISTAGTTPTGTYQVTTVFTETLPGPASALVILPLLLPLALKHKRTRQHVRAVAVVALLLSTLIAFSCGGGSSTTPPPPQTHQVTSSGVVAITVQ